MTRKGAKEKNIFHSFVGYKIHFFFIVLYYYSESNEVIFLGQPFRISWTFWTGVWSRLCARKGRGYTSPRGYPPSVGHAWRGLRKVRFRQEKKSVKNNHLSPTRKSWRVVGVFCVISNWGMFTDCYYGRKSHSKSGWSSLVNLHLTFIREEA